MKQIYLGAVLALLCASSSATEQDSGLKIASTASDKPSYSYSQDNTSYQKKYFSGEDNKLSQLEQEALKINDEFRRKSNDTKPISGGAGEIIYVYGAQSLDVVCAVLQVCDIALQPGEQINTIHLGDTARWLLEPAITGSAGTEQQHVIVKPLDIGLKTNLILATNRRTYHINLTSHKTKFMPLVSFAYPDEINNKVKFFKSAQYSAQKAQVLPDTKESISDLDFNYEIESDGQSWTPVRVYNNGRKTVIELPESVSNDEIPTFMVKDPYTDEDVLVNYRYQNHKFLVDSVFRQAVLIVGVGDKQQKVTIRRK